MSKLVEHAAYLTQDSENEDLVIFNIPIRIAKATVEMGGIESVAMVDGWTPENALSAPEFCIDVVKNLSRQKIDQAVRGQLVAAANEQANQIVSSLV